MPNRCAIYVKEIEIMGKRNKEFRMNTKTKRERKEERKEEREREKK